MDGMKHLGLLCGLLSLLSVPLRAVPVKLAAIKAHLVQWEGYRLSPYRDGPGYSVGIGHSLTANRERVKPRYTHAEVERLLYRDVSWVLDICRATVDRFDDLPESAQLVAIGVAFGVGRTGFARFTGFRRALGWRAYDLAASELHLSLWHAQVGPSRATTYINTLRSLP